LGGKIPRNIKVKVIRQWLDGLTRERIAKKEDIGAGTVTAIIQEARKEEEYNDIDLLREVSMKLKEQGLDLSILAFAFRHKKIMEENDINNDINEDQIESITQDFAAYCVRHKTSCDTIIKNGRVALYLEQKFDIPIERIPEYITQKKKTIDRLEYNRLEILRQTKQAREDRDAMQQERDAFVAELGNYRKEIPSIQRNIELENELAEEKEMNGQHEIIEKGLRKDLHDARCEAIRSRRDVVETNARYKDTASRLICCLKEQRRLREIK
jgi:hypothetical protein